MTELLCPLSLPLACGVTLTFEALQDPDGRQTIVVTTDESMAGFDAHLAPLIATSLLAGTSCAAPDSTPRAAAYGAALHVTASSVTLTLLGVAHTYPLTLTDRRALARTVNLVATHPFRPAPTYPDVPPLTA
ncbi:hypothetical protein [Deinococcus soli (ex Cha et al. 2016)]|uniref:hypothetical protein n=1 Tax=Deinococcus soli (ex Cha et al. 2016) TaxID=1309411 RepID=UPI001669D0B7|nr:hypothetical protein [Deinococcus soli (ex Cha et al. 2016)]GGB79570.1 hypothetical protein GCM10008019_39770 [Deinococcus soli (ex Cha et al. 2016)]